MLSKSLNKAMIIGNLGGDPEMRYSPGGRPVTCFSVATSRTWTDAGNASHEQLEWFNVVVWGELAEMCKAQLSQGQVVYVEGRLQTRAWEDQQGRQCCRTELVASQVVALGSHPDTAPPGAASL